MNLPPSEQALIARSIYLDVYSDLIDLDVDPETYLKNLTEDQINQIPFRGPDLCIDLILTTLKVNKDRSYTSYMTNKARSVLKACQALLLSGESVEGKNYKQIATDYLSRKLAI